MEWQGEVGEGIEGAQAASLSPPGACSGAGRRAGPSATVGAVRRTVGAREEDDNDVKVAAGPPGPAGWAMVWEKSRGGAFPLF